MRPKSSAATRIWRRSLARIVSSWTGTSYRLPVRLSTMVRVSRAASAAVPDEAWSMAFVVIPLFPYSLSATLRPAPADGKGACRGRDGWRKDAPFARDRCEAAGGTAPHFIRGGQWCLVYHHATR